MEEKIFKERCKELINDTEFNNKYCVEDILSDNIEIIFLLESPHNEEVKCKHPLAGKSGINMTKFFCKVFSLSEPKCGDKIVPFGKLIEDTHNSNINNEDFVKLYGNSELRDILKKIGIMNVCNIPMQMKVYCCDDVRKYCEILRALDFLREHPNTTENKDCYDKIINHFWKTMNSLSKIKLSIPMGKFAQANFSTYLKNKIESVIDNEIIYKGKKSTLINSIYKNRNDISDNNISKYCSKKNPDKLSKMTSNINEILENNKSFEISHPSPRNTEWSKIAKLKKKDFPEGKLKLLWMKLSDILQKNEPEEKC